MLEITIPEKEFFNESEGFIKIKGVKLQLEHSLISLKKWESKWHKPFLGKDDKTTEEIIDYIKCMTINQVPDKRIYNHIPQNSMKEVIDYIKDPMTATWFTKNTSEGPAKTNAKVITNEIIYFWMVSLNIPFECQKWHLNQLLTLIKVVNIESGPKKKMSKEEEKARRKALNDARLAKFKSKG